MAEHTSSFVRHEPCPECGSKDNLSRYDDGHAVCMGWSCNYTERGDGQPPTERRRNNVSLLREGEFSAIPNRGLDEETCRRLDYQVGRTKRGKCHIANYHNGAGRVAQHLRYKGKEMPWKGEPRDAYLFGQQAFKDQGKRLIITEGEIDALSVFQALNHRWPVVGVPGVNAVEFVKRNLEWCDAFGEVCLFFDQDEPGQESAREVAELFEPGKATIVRAFPYKDANEALQAGDVKAITDAQWNAERWWPDDLVESGTEEMFERIVNYEVSSDYDYEWPALQELTRGMRRGEMTLWTAGTGVGKSQTLKDIVLQVMAATHAQGKKIGLIMLEESIEITHIILCSMWLERDPMDWDDIPREDRRRAYDAVFGDGRFMLYDHWGSLESKRLFSKMRAMVKAGCDIVVLDHVSIVISGSDEADGGGERRVIDKVMTKLETMVKELQFVLHVIAHLKKGDGNRPHEEGGKVSMDDLRGSGTLKQIPDNIIAVERNTQAESEKLKTTARLKQLKNRLARRTGYADTLRFNLTTGRYDVVEHDDDLFDAVDEDNECSSDSDL